MRCDVILAGVGGQGVLSMAYAIDHAAMARGYFIKQSELHGMSQRGGAVSTHLRLSDAPIESDLICKGSADFVIAMEPMEALRYTAFLKPKGLIVTSAAPVKNIDDYPLEAVMAALKARSAHIVDADALAKEAGSQKSANLVLLGAAIRYLPFDAGDFEAPIASLFAHKGSEAVALNLKAFHLGVEGTLR